MKPRIEREHFLHPHAIRAGRSRHREDQVPAMAGNNTGDYNKLVSGKQRVAEGLLTGTGNTRAQPIWIWNRRWIDDIHVGEIVDDRCCQDVLDCVERLEPLMDRDLKNCSRRVG